MSRLRHQSPATGHPRLHRRRWRNHGEPRPSHTDLLEAAAEEAKHNGKSLTHIRKHVLNTLLNAQKPMTAYEVLDSLAGVGSVSPPTAYRALEFLIQLGFVQRVESLNAYLALDRGPSELPVPLFVCEKCGQAEEVDAPEAVKGLMQAVAAQDLGPQHISLEIRGDCRGKLGCDAWENHGQPPIDPLSPLDTPLDAPRADER